MEREGQGQAMGRRGGRGGGEEQPTRRLGAVWVCGEPQLRQVAPLPLPALVLSFQSFGAVAVSTHGCLLLRF